MPKAVKPPTGPRAYDSTRRKEQARATERNVLAAASELFLTQGYGRTTLAEVATSAGVSVETIYSRFRNKPGLLHRLWDITVGGDDEQVMLHERPEVIAMRAEPDLAKRLALQARFMAATGRRTGPFTLMVQAAADADPAAAKMLEEMDRQRLAGLSFMAAEAAATGQLSVTEEQCRDLMWALADGVFWHRLVQQRGWSDDDFIQHLTRMLVAALVR